MGYERRVWYLKNLEGIEMRIESEGDWELKRGVCRKKLEGEKRWTWKA